VPPWTGCDWLVVTIPSLAALVIGVTTVGRAALWRDEMATRQYALLSIPDVVHATGRMDRVHLAYDLFMHVWTSIFGAGAVSLRAPSLIAYIATAALVAEIARSAWGRPAALASGLTFTASGSALAFALTARSYSIIVCLVTAAFFALYRQSSRAVPRLSWWVLCATATAVAIVVHPLAVVLIPALAVLVVTRRRLWAGWILSTIPPVLATAFMLYTTRSQKALFGFISEPSMREAWNTFTTLTGFRFAAVVLAVAVAIFLAGNWVAPRRPGLRSAWRWDPAWGAALALLIVPAVILFAGSHLAQPMFVYRYLATVSVAVALLVGAAAGTVARFPKGRLPAALATVVTCMLILVGLAPGLHSTMTRTVVNDDFPALAAFLSTLPVGDAIIIKQPPEGGGYSEGIAYYTHDEALAADIATALVGPGEPLSAPRRIVATGPGGLTTEPIRGTFNGQAWQIGFVAPPLPVQGCSWNLDRVKYFGDTVVVPWTCTDGRVWQ
jgi:hypothetical protein